MASAKRCRLRRQLSKADFPTGIRKQRVLNRKAGLGMQIAGHHSASERTSGHRGGEFVFLQLVSVSFDESFSGCAFMSVICNFYESGFGAHREK